MNSMCKNCTCLNSTCNGSNETVWTGCIFKKTRNIIGSFLWQSGSINDGIRKILISKGMNYTNAFNGDILVNNQKVQYEFDDTRKDICIVYM